MHQEEGCTKRAQGSTLKPVETIDAGSEEHREAGHIAQVTDTVCTRETSLTRDLPTLQTTARN